MDNTALEALVERNQRVALAFSECFTGDAGERVLEHLREHVFRPRRTPRDGMTMQETAVFTLGEQSLFHTILQNIDNGRKAKAHA